MTFFLHSQLPERIGLTETLANIPLETEYGRLAKEALTPYDTGDTDSLEEAWRETGVFLKAHQEHPGIMKEVRHLLHGLHNIRKSIISAGEDEVLTDVELFDIKKQAFAMDRIRKTLHRNRSLLVPAVALKDVTGLIQLLDPENTGIETFYLYDAYDLELEKIRREKRSVEEERMRTKKMKERNMHESTGLHPLWNGEVLVSKSETKQKDRMDDLGTYEQVGETAAEWIYRQRRQSNDEMMESLLLQEERREHLVREKLSLEIGKHSTELMENTAALAHLDLLVGKTMLAVRHRACKPQLSQHREIAVCEGRHPVMEETLRKNRRQMIPVDLTIQQGATVITGANMGGKTMALKMTALLTALAQMGFWVPASSFRFQPVKWLYFSSGDEQSLALGLSTFGAEIHGLNKVLDLTDETGLILLDELASGTNPREGACISQAIVSYLSSSQAISVITTHYDGVGDMPGVSHLQVVGLNRQTLLTLQQKIRDHGWSPGLFEEAMDYRLEPREPGVPVPKDAIAVAEMMGLKSLILEKAREKMEAFEDGQSLNG